MNLIFNRTIHTHVYFTNNAMKNFDIRYYACAYVMCLSSLFLIILLYFIQKCILCFRFYSHDPNFFTVNFCFLQMKLLLLLHEISRKKYRLHTRLPGKFFNNTIFDKNRKKNKPKIMLFKL